MKVLLLEDIKALGKKGEVVEVKDGYAQNFLIAKGKAKLATNEVLNRYKAEQRNKAEQQALEQAQRETLAKQLKEIKISVTKKCGESGSLFGAITKDEIAHALAGQTKIEVDKKTIELETQIKHIGEYSISLNLGNGIHSAFLLEVKGE